MPEANVQESQQMTCSQRIRKNIRNGGITGIVNAIWPQAGLPINMIHFIYNAGMFNSGKSDGSYDESPWDLTKIAAKWTAYSFVGVVTQQAVYDIIKYGQSLIEKLY